MGVSVRSRRSRTFRRLAAVALVAVALAALALGVSGCGLVGGASGKAAPPSEPAGITGTITSVNKSDGGDAFGTILVEGGEQPAGAVSDKASVTITEDTVVSKNGRRITPVELAAGMKVRVWFEGAVAESYPVQGTARFIEVQ